MSLLDPNISEYVISWEIIGFNGRLERGTKGKIENQNKVKIGKFDSGDSRKSGYHVSVLNDNEILTLKIDAKSSWNMKIIVMDGQNNEIGIVKSKKRFRPKTFFLINSKDEEILISNIDFGKKTGEILNPHGKTIAEFSTLQEKIKRGFLRENLYKTTCDLKILDETFDKKSLLGFFFAIIDIVIPPPADYGA